MSRPAIVMDAGKVEAQVQQVNRNLDVLRNRYIASVTKAIVEFTTDTIAEAQQGTAVRTGNLRGSAVVQEPQLTDAAVSCVGGFNIGYAAQRNYGGTIYPTKSKMLAIPLDPIMTGRGVPRYSSPREEQGLFILKLWGRVFLAKRTQRTVELHWVLKDHVEQRGDGFFSKVIDSRKGQAAAAIAARTLSAMGDPA